MKHLKTFMSVLAILAAVSCGKSQSTGEGQVSFGISSNDNIADVTRSNVSDYTALPASGDFIISIKDKSGKLVWDGKVTDWDPTTPILAGNYSVTAEYGDIEEEGFNKPYFTGTTEFAIKGDEVKTVSIPVSLGNTIVKISCTQDFKNYYKSYSFKLTRNRADVVDFASDESKAAFIDGYTITLEGALESETRSSSFTKTYDGLDPATAYTFVFDIDNIGGASIVISFNDKTELVTLDDVELND